MVGATAAIATATVGANIAVASIVCGLVVVLMLLLLLLVVTMALRRCGRRLMKMIAIIVSGGPTSLMVVILIWGNKLHPEIDHLSCICRPGCYATDT